MLIKLCPNCTSHRPIDEFLCSHVIDGKGLCRWDLTLVPPIDEEAIPLSQTSESTSAKSTLVCPNGHTVEPGDNICIECGMDLVPGVEAAMSPRPRKMN